MNTTKENAPGLAGHRRALSNHRHSDFKGWREHLPSPESYYRVALEKLGRPNAAGWAQGVCPFHEDRQASLSANLTHGGWRCFAGCGQGDLMSFHMRRTGLQFADAVRDLTGGRP